MAITYAQLLERQEANRTGFGRMLLNWRRRNGWTQYTACSWADEAGFDTISYGNLSVIEQGKAGELRRVVEDYSLDPSEAITSLAAVASEEHRKRFYAVLTGFGDYKPEELAPLWIEADHYQPKRWLDQWEDSNRQRRQPSGSKGKKPMAPP